MEKNNELLLLGIGLGGLYTVYRLNKTLQSTVNALDFIVDATDNTASDIFDLVQNPLKDTNEFDASNEVLNQGNLISTAMVFGSVYYLTQSLNKSIVSGVLTNGSYVAYKYVNRDQNILSRSNPTLNPFKSNHLIGNISDNVGNYFFDDKTGLDGQVVPYLSDRDDSLSAGVFTPIGIYKQFKKYLRLSDYTEQVDELRDLNQKGLLQNTDYYTFFDSEGKINICDGSKPVCAGVNSNVWKIEDAKINLN